MPIPFNPPEGLLNAYMNRKSPVQESLDSAVQLAQVYSQLQQQKKTNALAQESKDIELAKLRGTGGQQGIDTLNAIRRARGLPPLTIPATATPGQVPAVLPAGGAMAPEANFQPDSGMPPQAVNSSGSPVIGHWNSTMGSSGGPIPPTGKPQAPAMGSDPSVQEWVQLGDRAYADKYGTDEATRVKGIITAEKGLQERTNVGIGQYGALQSGSTEDLLREFPEGIPPSLATSALSAQSRNIRVTDDPYGNPIRVPVAGGPATPIEMPGQNFNPLQKKLNPNEYKAFQAEINDFDKDKTVSDNRVMLNNMANVESMLAGYNPALTGPIASRQARAIAGEVGALTDSDIARQTLDPSLLGRFKKAVSVAATGKLPKDQLDLLRQSISTIKRGAQSRVSSVAKERASRLSRQFGGKVSPEELMQSMDLPSNFPSGEQAQTSGGLTPEKQARLEELRRKKAEGTLR